MFTEDKKRHEIDFNDSKTAFIYKSDKDLKFSVLMFRLMSYRPLTKIGGELTELGLKLKLPIKGIIKATIFRQFCGGETLEECNSAIVDLAKANIGSILDYSVEGIQDEAVFDAVTDELLRVCDKAAKSPNIPVTCMKITGVAEFALLEKLSKPGRELTNEEKNAYQKVVTRVNRICERAHKNDVPIYIDAEESWIQPALDRLIGTMMRKYNKKKAIVFTTFQMYKHSMLPVLERMIGEAKREGFKFGIKFVRGAYMEKENKRAEKLGYSTPIQPSKEATDEDFDKAVEFALGHLDVVEMCCGTHNELSCYKLVDLMDDKGIKPNHSGIYFSQLYGMSDNISFNLANAGYNVTKYLPYGPVEKTIPYLLRRAEENSAITGQMGKELRFLLAEKKRREDTGERVNS